MKRFLPYILIGIVIIGLTTPLTARAMAGGCVPPGFDITKCAANVTYYLVFIPTSAILWFSGQFFNGAVFFSLNGKVISAQMASDGWTITRDVANLFFIFILLYIAIATILQLSGYGMKNLLAKLVIIALLVNFSLVITKVIIDASNILALEFYNKMTVSGGSVTVAIFGQDAKDISAVFIAGFDPQQLFGTKAFDDWAQKTAGSSLVMFVLFLIASIMNLIASFILFAGGGLFIIRIAVLWLLMILAPIAFLFMVLPKTKSYADQWWDKLFNQSFFAPAFLFLFYLVAKLVTSGFLKSVITSANVSSEGKSGVESFFQSILIVIIHFSVLIILLVACLIVAQKMGAVGASTVRGWGKDIKKAATGYAGRVGKRYAGRAMAAAEKGLEGEGRVAGVLRKVPILQRGLAAGAQLKKKEIGAYEKQYAGYDAKTLEQLKGKFGTTSEARAAMEKIIKKKKQKEQEDEILKTGSSIDQVRVLAQRARERVEELELEKEAATKKTLYDAQGQPIRKPGEEKEKPKLYDASGRLIT